MKWKKQKTLQHRLYRCYIIDPELLFVILHMTEDLATGSFFFFYPLYAVFSHAHKNVPLWPLKCRLWQVRSCRGSAHGLYTTLNNYWKCKVFWLPAADACQNYSHFCFTYTNWHVFLNTSKTKEQHLWLLLAFASFMKIMK